MAIGFDLDLRNALLDAIDTFVGTDGWLVFYDLGGAAPADCGTAMPGGTVTVATIDLPSPAFGPASAGAMAINGTWEDTSADNTGTIDFFRIFKNADLALANCVMQGTVSESGGGGDMIVDNDTVNSGQAVSVTAFNLTAPNVD